MSLEKEDIDRLKEIFVTRQECDNTMDDVNKKLANDSTELALIKQQLAVIAWFSKTTFGVIVAAIIGAILKLILVG